MININHQLFSQRLKNAIENSGMTVDEIEKELGITNRSLECWLQGKLIPRTEALYSIAQLIGCSADYLLGLSDSEKINPDIKLSKAYQLVSKDCGQSVQVLLWHKQYKNKFHWKGRN